MNAAALWRFLRHRVFIFDPWLSTVLLAISLISLVTMYRRPAKAVNVWWCMPAIWAWQ